MTRNDSASRVSFTNPVCDGPELCIIEEAAGTYVLVMVRVCFGSRGAAPRGPAHSNDPLTSIAVSGVIAYAAGGRAASRHSTASSAGAESVRVGGSR